MGTFYFVIAFVVILGFYAFSNIILKKDYVIAGDAFSSRNLTHDEIKDLSSYKKHKIFKDTNGNIINPKNMIRMVVSGNSMSPLRINSGDEIIALKIDKKKPLDQQIKKDNLVLIYLNDIGIYKIRAFHSFDGNNKLLTYYYNEYGEKVMSKVGYSPDSIRGIVKYKVGI